MLYKWFLSDMSVMKYVGPSVYFHKVNFLRQYPEIFIPCHGDCGIETNFQFKASLSILNV